MAKKVLYDSGTIQWHGGSAPNRRHPLANPLESTGTEATPAARGPMPVIVGCPRSGTSLLAVMLDSHPQIAIPPETAFLPHLRSLAGTVGTALRHGFFALLTADRWGVSNWNDFGIDKVDFWHRLCALRPFSITGGLRVFYGMYADRLERPLFGEKTPADTHCMPEIEQYLPEARFVHIVRDPRDVVLSLRRTTAGQSIERTARIWVDMVSRGRASAAQVRHYHEVRYENLVLEPEAELRKVCAFLQLEYGAQMLDYRAGGERYIQHLGDRRLPDGRTKVRRELRAKLHENLAQPLRADRVHGWRGQMSEEDRAEVEAVAAPLMREMGYDIPV